MDSFYLLHKVMFNALIPTLHTSLQKVSKNSSSEKRLFRVAGPAFIMHTICMNNSVSKNIMIHVGGELSFNSCIPSIFVKKI